VLQTHVTASVPALVNQAVLPALIDWQPRTRLIFGAGVVEQAGALAAGLGLGHVLLVCDPGMVRAGYAERVGDILDNAGIRVTRFDDFSENPDGDMCAAGAAAARAARVDGFVALGGGSSLDCAKGANFLHADGGVIADFRGYGKVRGTMLPMIGIPTTAGTGSDAQSYAVLSDAGSHVKMACGDPGAAFRIALLDPALTVSQPASVTAASGYDALSHAVEAFVTTSRTPLSQTFAREAFRLVRGQLAQVLRQPEDLEARGAMLLGSHLAGLAIESSMLGAGHACANPLTAQFDVVHGVAVALMLPHVVRWNAAEVGPLYADLLDGPGTPDPQAGERLAAELEQVAALCGFPLGLSEAGVTDDALPALAEAAAAQWTGGFNPRPLTREAALALYRAALRR
jgi:alcohol dehydrogenase